MKAFKILLVVSTFIIVSIPSFSQKVYEAIVYDTAEYRVTYNMRAQLDSTNPEWIINREAYLFIGDECSKFISKGKFEYDTIVAHYKTLDRLCEYFNGRVVQPVGFLYTIIKNVPKGKQSHHRYFMPTHYLLEESLDLQEWELHDQVDSIEGYVVRKATCRFGGREWTAWYTPEIPISDGPYKFNGLPGLILNLYDSHNHYVFEFSEMIKPNKPVQISVMKSEFVNVSREQFLKAEDNWIESAIATAKARGMANESIQAIKKRPKLKNNPIELDRN